MTLYCHLEVRFNSKNSYKFFSFHCKYEGLLVMKEFVKQKRATMQYFGDKYGLSSMAFSTVGCRQRWARYSIFELIDTRYLKIELIDADTRYFEEVLNRYSYCRYKYLDVYNIRKKIN